MTVRAACAYLSTPRWLHRYRYRFQLVFRWFLAGFPRVFRFNAPTSLCDYTLHRVLQLLPCAPEQSRPQCKCNACCLAGAARAHLPVRMCKICGTTSAITASKTLRARGVIHERVYPDVRARGTRCTGPCVRSADVYTTPRCKRTGRRSETAASGETRKGSGKEAEKSGKKAASLRGT